MPSAERWPPAAGARPRRRSGIADAGECARAGATAYAKKNNPLAFTWPENTDLLNDAERHDPEGDHRPGSSTDALRLPKPATTRAASSNAYH